MVDGQVKVLVKVLVKGDENQVKVIRWHEVA
jgi:hypothetical protein